jgi:hypothetical protein
MSLPAGLPIPESDWKVFKPPREAALERFCERVLNDVADLAATPGASYHERHLEIYRLLQERDRDLDRTFDSLRRSTALYQLAAFQQQNLIGPKDVDRFTPETRERVAILTGR